MSRLRDRGLRWLLLAIYVLKVGAIEGQDSRFMIVSSPTESNVLYKILPSFETRSKLDADYQVTGMSVLINGAQKCMGTSCTENSDQGLKSPQGIALWHGGTSRVLYVSDCEAKNIYKYELTVVPANEDQSALIHSGPQKAVLRNVPGGARWLTTDGLGNLFFSVEEKNEIQMIPVEDLNKPPGSAAAKILYTAAGSSTVSGPGGIVADNFYLYWTNKANGQAAGTVIEAYERPKTSPLFMLKYPKVLAMNLDRAYGICMVKDTLYFTHQDTTLFAVKKGGGAIAEVSGEFQEPRGCSWDGDGGLYVADRKANAIYRLPANFKDLRVVKHITKVADVTAPCQVLILTAPAHSIQPLSADSISATFSAGVLLMSLMLI
jgi:hypothetical protein